MLQQSIQFIDDVWGTLALICPINGYPFRSQSSTADHEHNTSQKVDKRRSLPQGTKAQGLKCIKEEVAVTIEITFLWINVLPA
jgi:hypothetical protein